MLISSPECITEQSTCIHQTKAGIVTIYKKWCYTFSCTNMSLTHINYCHFCVWHFVNPHYLNYDKNLFFMKYKSQNKKKLLYQAIIITIKKYCHETCHCWWNSTKYHPKLSNHSQWRKVCWLLGQQQVDSQKEMVQWIVRLLTMTVKRTFIQIKGKITDNCRYFIKLWQDRNKNIQQWSAEPQKNSGRVQTPYIRQGR